MGGARSKAEIVADHLAVARGGRTLFADLSFRVAAGDAAEIRGPNGSGKTSLLRALAGFLRPSAGRVAFEGVTEPSLAVHMLGHRDGLKAPLDARAHVRFWAGLLGGTASGIEPALARVGLARLADLPARALSQGQARRLALARLLVAPRPIWLLDEPSAGLDAGGAALVADLIAEHRAGGGLAIIATHDELRLPNTQTIALELA